MPLAVRTSFCPLTVEPGKECRWKRHIDFFYLRGQPPNPHSPAELWEESLGFEVVGERAWVRRKVSGVYML